MNPTTEINFDSDGSFAGFHVESSGGITIRGQGFFVGSVSRDDLRILSDWLQAVVKQNEKPEWDGDSLVNKQGLCMAEVRRSSSVPGGWECLIANGPHEWIVESFGSRDAAKQYAYSRARGQ